MRRMETGPFANVKGVFFDLDGTLKVSTPNGVDAVLDYMSDCGIAIDHEARRAGHRFAHEYWADRDRVEDDMEHLDPDTFWANYIRSKIVAMKVLPAGEEPDNSVVTEINRRFANEFSPSSHIADHTLDILKALRQKDFIVGLVSNRPLPLRDTAERLGIYEYFHFTLAAGEIGSWKPDSGIFRRALEMAGNLSPQQAVYIGDNYYADAIGAHSAGLRAILIDPLHAFPEAEEIAFIISDLADLLQYLNETGETTD